MTVIVPVKVITAGHTPLKARGIAESVVFILATEDAASAFPENAAVAAIASAENNRRFIVVSFFQTNMGGTAARGREEIHIERPL